MLALKKICINYKINKKNKNYIKTFPLLNLSLKFYIYEPNQTPTMEKLMS